MLIEDLSETISQLLATALADHYKDSRTSTVIDTEYEEYPTNRSYIQITLYLDNHLLGVITLELNLYKLYVTVPYRDESAGKWCDKQLGLSDPDLNDKLIALAIRAIDMQVGI